MRLGLLGTLEVIDDDGTPVDIRGAQARIVLGVLLSSVGRVVPADTLIDAVWGEDPPLSALGSLQSYVSRLRRALGEGEVALHFEPPGYRLDAPVDCVDFRRFEARADEGHEALLQGEPETARAALVEGEALWRAALLEFADRPFAVGVANRLEERRLAAIEDRFDADLQLGRHGIIIGELAQLVAAQPLRERLWALLALARYRAGHQADALRALADARRILRDELGIDPGADAARPRAADPRPGSRPRSAARPARGGDGDGLGPGCCRDADTRAAQEAHRPAA
jgi:DNA-binding SARP family transcriptional activator